MLSIEDLVHRFIHDPDFDHWLQPHQRSVEAISLELANSLGLPMGKIRIAARCHDVGKLALSLDIWNKPGTLSMMEKRIVTLHSEIGEKMVAAHLNEASQRIVRHHHEWYDGNGYPDGLTGAAIPVEARIIAVADAFDSLISDRPYRKGIGQINALIEIWRCSGSQFDPIIVRAFEDVLRQGLPVHQIRLQRKSAG
ncbi:MAG: HD domain-containing protein [Dehalococcoidia bacterium]|nr:HD domain-containing protein [Dehalococcoidia bacterium]